MTAVLYGVAKFIGYSFWAYVGYRMHQQRPGLSLAMKAGAARWLLGLGIGAALFFVVTPTREELLKVYFAVYIPVRFFEWLIVGKIFYKDWPSPFRNFKFYIWIIGGIILSFLIDMVSPEMIEDGRFCVGRCLC